MKLEKAFDNFIPFIPLIYLLLNFIPGFIYKIIFGVILFACLLYQNSKERIKFNKINIAIIFLFVYLIGHFLLIESHVPTNAILLIYNSFMLFSLVNLMKKDHMVKVSRILFFFGTGLILLAVYETFTGNYHFLINSNLAIRSEKTGLNYPLIFFYNFNDLAYFLTLILPFSIYAIIEKTKKPILSIIYIVLTLAVGYFTQSIFAEIAAIAYLGFILLACLVRNSSFREVFKKQKNKILVVVGLILIVVIMGSVPLVIQFMKTPIFTSRFNLLQQAFKIIANNLWFGVGSGGYQDFMTMPPHNFFLNLGVSIGLIGALSVSFIYIQTIYDYIKNTYPNFFDFSLQKILGFSLVLFFMTNMMSSQTEGIFITWMFLGLTIVAFKEVERR